GQSGLSPVQSLDLTLLVQTEHQRLLRRIEIQADHVGQLLQKLRIAREFESSAQVRLKIVQLPQSVDGAGTDLLRLGHEPATPVGHPFGFGLQGRVNDGVTLGLVILRLDPASRSNFPNLVDAPLPHAVAPEFDRMPVNSKSVRDGPILLTGHRSQNNLAAQSNLLGSSVSRHPLLQLRLNVWFQEDGNAFLRHEVNHTTNGKYV